MDLTNLAEADLHLLHHQTLREANIATRARNHYEREATRLNLREQLIRNEFDRRFAAQSEANNKKEVVA